MIAKACKQVLVIALAFLALPAWAGSIGLKLGSGGKISFTGGATHVSARGKLAEFSVGKELFPVIGSFSFVTGNVSGRQPNEWLFGAGGHLSFSGCLDIDLDHGKCDKKDFKGSLLTGTFKSAEIIKTGKNTFTLDGQVWLVVAPALATKLGISSSVPFLADFTLNFTTCVGHSDAIPCGYKTRITSGTLSSVPEPPSSVLLVLGIILAGFGHKMLLSRYCLRA